MNERVENPSRRAFLSKVILDGVSYFVASHALGIMVNEVRDSKYSVQIESVGQSKPNLDRFISFNVQPTFSVNNLKLDIVGVTHIVPTFMAYQEDITKHIKKFSLYYFGIF